MENDRKIVKHYSNGEITIVWQPDLCTHIAYCFTELPEVFDPTERPWINAMGASTQKIIDQVNRCPTDALTFFYNDASKNNLPDETMEQNDYDSVRIEIIENGPALIKGHTIIVDKNGVEKTCDKTIVLCRCGHSNNKPYCDGMHSKNKFE